MSQYNSPNNDRIRQLNQRHAPNSNPHHSRFPSVSDVSDSPSVYSCSPYTPRPFDKVEQPIQTLTFDDQDQEPGTFDVSDDPRTSYATARTNYGTEDTYDSRDGLSLTEDDEPENRISVLGIKMRFHSKAPWEAGGEDTPEEEHERNSGDRPPSRSKRSIKGFTVRPSVDSSRSGNRSLEAYQYSIGGALQTLAQASISSASLIPPQSGTTQTSLRQKLSLPKIRTRAVSGSTTSPSSPRSAMYSPPLSKGPSSPRSEHWNTPTDVASMFTDRSPSPISHPYANPELSRTRTRDSVYPKSFVSFDTQSEESFPQSMSMATFPSSGATSNSLTTPLHHSTSTKTKSRPRDREISGPIPLPSQNSATDSKVRENFGAIPGWQEQTHTGFSLITLEEARAQRRLTQLDPGTGLSSTVPQPEYSTPPHLRPHTRSIGSGGKAKAVLQSVVTDFNRPAKQRNDPPQTQDSTVGQGVKSLKHKKSGFMRIFSKEKAPTVPDTPNLPLEESRPIPPVPRTPRLRTHRVPVPPISPAINTAVNSPADFPASPESTVDAHSPNSRPSPKRVIPPLCINTSNPATNRTFNQTHQASNSLGSNPLHPPNPDSAPPASNGGSGAQSAPPGKTDFVALSLRPVSTVFSSQFTDQLMAMENKTPPEPALDADSGTPTTATGSGGISPLSPDFVSLRDLREELSRPITVTSAKSSSDDSRQDVIRALQGQIFGAKEDWQRHIWELESQVRDLKAEIREMRRAENSGRYCEVCGRGRKKSGSVNHHRTPGNGVGYRPRAHTTTNSPR